MGRDVGIEIGPIRTIYVAEFPIEVGIRRLGRGPAQVVIPKCIDIEPAVVTAKLRAVDPQSASGFFYPADAVTSLHAWRAYRDTVIK